MHGTTIKTAILLIGLAAAAPGCGSRAAAVCEVICACEHCNDYDEDVSCRLLEAQEDVAGAYECGDAFDAWATCVEEKGRCDAKDADFTTRQTGSCSVSDPVGITCLSDNDCDGFGNGLLCEGGMCMQRMCAGGGNQSCESDGDCEGADLCTAQQDALDKCIDSASAHGGPQFDLD